MEEEEVDVDEIVDVDDEENDENNNNNDEHDNEFDDDDERMGKLILVDQSNQNNSMHSMSSSDEASSLHINQIKTMHRPPTTTATLLPLPSMPKPAATNASSKKSFVPKRRHVQ